MARNIELLTQIRDLAEADPAKLDMGIWVTVHDMIDDFNGGKAKVTCGTTGCIAGWAVQLAGDKLLVREDAYDEDENEYNVYESVARNGRVSEIEPRARKLLGLDYDEADVLFFVDDEEVVSTLNALISGKDIVPDDWND